jgi:hypothetical protein
VWLASRDDDGGGEIAAMTRASRRGRRRSRRGRCRPAAVRRGIVDARPCHVLEQDDDSYCCGMICGAFLARGYKIWNNRMADWQHYDAYVVRSTVSNRIM